MSEPTSPRDDAALIDEETLVQAARGVDRSQINWMLSLTLSQRLRASTNAAHALAKLQREGKVGKGIEGPIPSFRQLAESEPLD